MTCEVKFVEVTYNATSVFMIPKNWKEEDYTVKWDTVFYKDSELDLRVFEAECDCKHPDDQVELEDDDVYNSEQFFECQEPDSTAVAK